MTQKILFAILCIISSIVLADLTGSLSKEAIEARLQPIGEVNVSGIAVSDKPAAAGQGGPEKIYQRYCSACHASGFAGAPVRGNKKDWAPRITRGLDQLTEDAWGGYHGIMPPKGNCAKCTKDEIRATVKMFIDDASK
jgi:cytochrome c5